MEETRSRSGWVTLKDIATRCGVSVPTVSRALRYPERHSAALTSRIQAIAAELGYDPDLHAGARRLVLSRFGRATIHHLIALVFPPYFFRSPFFAETYQGILDVLSPAGFGLLVLDTESVRANRLPPNIRRCEIDGLIVAERLLHLEALLRVMHHNEGLCDCPVTSLFTQSPRCYNVSVDNVAAGEATAGHLLDLGHRRILHMRRATEAAIPAGHQRQLREEGYARACKTRGLDPNAVLHTFLADTDFWHQAIDAAANPLFAAYNFTTGSPDHPLARELREHPEITAVLAPNDGGAILTRHYARAAGRRVPDDLSIVGFDDTTPMFDDAGENMLTTLHMPLNEIGRQAAHLALKQAFGEDGELNRTTIIDATLIIRGSTVRR